jgi:hypothetical protein
MNVLRAAKIIERCPSFCRETMNQNFSSKIRQSEASTQTLGDFSSVNMIGERLY